MIAIKEPDFLQHKEEYEKGKILHTDYRNKIVSLNHELKDKRNMLQTGRLQLTGMKSQYCISPGKMGKECSGIIGR